MSDYIYNTSLTFVYTVIISLQYICFGVLFVVLGIVIFSYKLNQRVLLKFKTLKTMFVYIGFILTLYWSLVLMV